MTAPATNSPSGMLVFEDFAPGHYGTFGPRHVSREDILAFAAEFDPQPMHLDEEAAKHSMLGGLSGSGWHLGSLTMRMMFDAFLHRAASLGSPGVETLRWMAPLRPGDDITLDLDVLDCRASRSRPEMGFVKFKARVSNAAGTTLLELVSPLMIKRRSAAAAEG